MLGQLPVTSYQLPVTSYQCYRVPMSYQRYRGFTLVEMSIVLVIIGLILGGVMGGQALVRSARLNSVVTDLHKYEAYLGTFRLKYDALPGDIKNAYDYWGVALVCTNALSTSGGTGCNGDGNGQITWNTEGYRAWQHLTASEIMPGSYTGVATGDTAVIGTNVPASRVDGGGYSWYYGTGLYGKSGNWIVFGAAVANSYTAYYLVNAPEAQGIDKKMDDGLAAYGNVVAFDGAGATAGDCINTTPTPDEYAISKTTTGCRMYIKMD